MISYLSILIISHLIGIYNRVRVSQKNQCEALYIIKPTEIHTFGVMIYAYRDDIHADAWWYTKPVGLDKKIRQVETCRIFWYDGHINALWWKSTEA